MRPARAERWHPAILLGMEPHPPDRGPGRIIFLNGASSTGKSTLAKAMQETLAEPFLHVSSDHLVVSGMLPARRDREGAFAWGQQMRPRFFDGFHRCLPALAAAGNDLDVDTTNAIPDTLAEFVLAAWRSRASRRALWQGGQPRAAAGVGPGPPPARPW
jgi:chloramphenicol 3-O-phosphotransferase